MTYSTRNIKYPDDKEYLTNILNKYLEFKKGAKSSIEWNYESDLVNTASGRILLYKDDSLNEHQIGSLNVLSRTFLVNRKHYKASLLGDFVVELQHRTLSPALKLSKDIAKYALENSVFVYGLPNKKAFPVLKMSGFKSIGLLTRYAYITSYSIFLPRIFHMPVMPFFVGAIIDLIKGSWTHFINILSLSNHKIEEVSAFDDDFDTLIKYSEFNQLIANTRSAAYLNWRYFKNSEHDYRVLVCRKNDNNFPKGYVVIEVEQAVIHIRDIFAATSEVFSVLLKAVKEMAININSGVISFSFLGASSIIDLIRKSGFKPRESIRHFIVKADNEELWNMLNNKDNWFIVDGDEDQ